MNQLPALKDVFSYKSLVHAIAGATGSSVAITVFYPIEVARVRIQVEDGRKAKYSPQLVAEIFEEEGLAALFRGWFPVVTSICCSNFVYFYVFNSLKAISYPKGTKPYPAKDLLLAFLSGVVNVLLTTPLWVANTRLKLQGARLANKNDDDDKTIPKYNYKGLVDAMATIAKKEGIAALWSGTVPSIILATNPAVQFMVYEALKRRIQGEVKRKNLTSFTYFMMGAISKMIATVVTYPLQVVQARSRAGRGDGKGAGLIGLIKALQKLSREQGTQGLYKGLEAKLTQTVLMGALMFLTYEKIAAVVFKVMRQEMIARKEQQ